MLRSGLLNGGDERTADDGGVGEFDHGGKLLRGGNAEADGDGEGRKTAEAADELLGVGGEGFCAPVMPVREMA